MNRRNTPSIAQSARPHRARGVQRSGAILVLFLCFMVIAILLTALTLNWSFLVLVQRDMQWRGQAIALAAAPALLDEDLLEDNTSQADDLMVAVAIADSYRQLNNAVTGTRLQLAAADVLVDAGRVDDIEQLIGTGNDFQTNEPYNTLRVRILRDSASSTAVEPLVNGDWDADPVDVAATSYVTLDNHLIGWRPTATANSPLLPISVLASDWVLRSTNGADNFPAPPNGNNILELEVRLNSSDAMAAPGNAALVSLDTTAGVSLLEVLEQIADGAEPSDLSGGTLAAPASLNAQSVASSQTSTDMLVSALNAELNSCRVLLLHEPSGTSGKVDLVGFAGVRIVAVEDEDPSADHQLKLTVEPCFVIHFTAWTDPSAAANTWIHKLRVRR